MRFGTKSSKGRTPNAQRPRLNASDFDVAFTPFASPRPFAIFRLPMNLLINFCLVLFVLVAGLMILVILMQRPKSEGLGAAFGSGVTENIFGAQTTNVLVKFTGWLTGIFFVLTFVLSILYAHQTINQSALRSELMKSLPPPAASASPGASASVAPGAPASPAASARASGAPSNQPAAPIAQPSPSSAVG